jgi:hypothetical protein
MRFDAFPLNVTEGYFLQGADDKPDGASPSVSVHTFYRV